MTAAKRQATARHMLGGAAAEIFAARAHDAWRRQFLSANPAQKGRPRMRLRGGLMVDVNQPWSRLHPNAKAENTRAGHDAYAAITKFPNDREAAADFIHKCWIKRNKHDSSQPKALFRPYRLLPEIEKDKDRAHVDQMKAALAAVRRTAKRAKVTKATYKTVRIEAKHWVRLEKTARALSALLGRPVSAEALLLAGIDAMVSVGGAVAAGAKPKRDRT